VTFCSRALGVEGDAPRWSVLILMRMNKYLLNPRSSFVVDVKDIIHL